jgi:uncharacterized protein YciI
MRFDTFTVVLLRTGPANSAPAPGEPDPVQDGHLARLAELHAGGQLLAAGPFRIEAFPDVRGIAIFCCDGETAQRLMADDPAVKAGRFAVVDGVWRCPADVLTAGPGRLPTSIADAIG